MSVKVTFCRGKRVYASKAEASAAGLRSQYNAFVRRYCRRCGGWHLVVGGRGPGRPKKFT